MNTEASPAPSRLRCRVMFKIDSLSGNSEKQGAASRSWTRKNQGQLCFGKKIVDNNIRCAKCPKRCEVIRWFVQDLLSSITGITGSWVLHRTNP
jgi:hypothetical protein